MTVWIAVECPDCYSTDIIKHGKSLEDKQRYLCQNSECLRRSFILDYSYPGRTRRVKQQMVEMSLNSSGIRDTARVLKVGATTVIRELKKKKPFLRAVNQKALENLKLEQVEVEIYKVEEAEEIANSGVEESELDEMWSFVRRKKNQRWLWHAIDRTTGQVLAYVFGRRKDEVFRALQKLLEPFGIQKYCTDGWGAYERNLSEDKHEIGKRKTQRIERKHLNLRTRIKRLQRKTICFSKTEEMHDLVIGLFINRYEFGVAI
jgi:IS1 family transposase/transposase-like protein